MVCRNNESIAAVSGKWVALLDADVIAPPDFLDGLDRHRDMVAFITSDGRKMLDAAATARILLGQTRPWEPGEYAKLLEGAGDYRKRESDDEIPVGYCQCVRRDVLDKVKYIEFNHFEGADWFFGKQVREEFGKEARIEGMVMLHLDHGGSQWYGTGKQM